VEEGNINNKQEWRNRGPLGRAYRNWGEHLEGPLVKKAACPARQERLGPGHKIRVDPFGLKHAAEGGGVDVVETPLDV